MNDPRSAEILWIGDACAELAAARHVPALEQHANVIDFVDVPAAILWLTGQPTTPDLIVISQSRPGQIAHESIEQLRRHAPLARLAGLLGSWCEGESRSGRPWPDVERVYWHQWPAWIASELASFRAGRTASWSMPRTATLEERWLAMHHEQQYPNSGDGLVAIVSPRRDLAQALSDACAKYGRRAVCLDRPPCQLSGVDRVIWDADRCGAFEAAELGSLVRAVHPAPVIALLAFPRIEEQQRALAAGARAVFSKPCNLLSLLA